jgi:hypothetical protein
LQKSNWPEFAPAFLIKKLLRQLIHIWKNKQNAQIQQAQNCASKQNRLLRCDNQSVDLRRNYPETGMVGFAGGSTSEVELL